MESHNKFTMKEILTVLGILLTMAGTYFKVQYDIDYLIKENQQLTKKMDKYEARLSVYSGLPSQVNQVELTVQDNAKMLNVIHDGLVAKGIIPPRRN